MSALMDPAVDTLAGMAQGFAQAAMPSRMPVPLGAVAGMAAGGAMQGARDSQQMQIGAQQLQAARMQNQVTQSGVPLAVARNQALTGMWNNPQGMMNTIYGTGGTPFGAPQTPGPPAAASSAPSATPPASSGPSPVVSAAFGSLPDDNTRKLATNAIMQSGLPPAAVPAWLSTVHNESGWNLNEPDGAAGEIGPGQVKPATGQTMGFTPQQLRDPQTNLTASAKYFAQQWAAGNNDPASAMAGYNTGTPDPTKDPAYVQSGMSRLAAWGGAPASQNATAQSAQAASDQYLAQANDLERRQGAAKMFGLPPPPGDPAALRQAAEDYRQVALAGPKAAAEAQAGVPAAMAKQGFVIGPNGALAPIPGGPADPAYVGAAESAKAMADAQASRTKLITTRAGVFDPVSGKEIYRQPEYHELQAPGTGAEYPAFVQPGDNGTLNITGGPPGMNGATPPSKLGPGQEDIIKHLADQYGNEDKQKYEGALNSEFQLSQQDKNIANLNATGGWSSTGAGADARLQWAKNINSAFSAVGATPAFDPGKVASWEDATKLQTQLAFAQAKQLGSREAQQVITMSRAATPGAENTAQGYQSISSGYHEMNTREKDLYNFKTNWLPSHGGNLTGAETAFNNQFTPAMYAARAVSNVTPVTISDPKQLSNYLPGTFVTDGKTISPTTGKPMIVQVPMRAGAPTVPDYLQQGGK